jgi:hypothetical protein
MNVVFRNDGTHLHAVCEGVWDPIALTDVARQIRATADRMSHDKVLIDWTGVSAPSDYTHRIFAGEDVASILSPPLRVAVLNRKVMIRKVAEDVALSRGASMLVHHDHAHLVDWLLRVSSSPTRRGT